MQIREKYTCPLELIHDMMKGKWKPIIIWRLRLGPTSLSNLKKDINGISEKMLLEQLSELIDFDFVQKNTFSGYPLRVEYFLTEHQGVPMLEALTIMQQLGIQFMKNHGMEQDLKEKGIKI